MKDGTAETTAFRWDLLHPGVNESPDREGGNVDPLHYVYFWGI